MDLTVPQTALTELAAAYFQVAVTLALVVMCVFLYRSYGKAHFALWALAWAVYATRLGAIIAFLHTGASGWLYWHQVTTGWTALALLWAALVFSQRTPWRSGYLAVLLFPPVWSYVAIYRMDHFLLAAGPAVLFLSGATAWMAWAFFRYHRAVRSPAALFLAVTLSLWAVHHLDYPFLRARGIWNPWGYYLDLVFELGMGLGILLLVIEDLKQGLHALTALSGELQRRRQVEGVPEAVLRRALGLRGVHGSALYLTDAEGGWFVKGAGVCTLWPHEGPPGPARRAVERVRRTGSPEVVPGSDDRAGGGLGHPYIAALPVLEGDRVAGALVVVGEVRDPFTVLDDTFLVAFGQQVGAALENEELDRVLDARTRELERLQDRMVRQHEEERERLGRELHDETAQVLAALNMQLGLLRERAPRELEAEFDQARALVGEGIKSIRSVTRNLRPTALDDLGLLPALRALARDFDRPSLAVAFHAPERLPELTEDAELALYRSMQESLSNVVRHAEASNVDVILDVADGHVELTVCDDGRGFPGAVENLMGGRRTGLAGIRERIAGLGGFFRAGSNGGQGARIDLRVPRTSDANEPDLERNER